jgi:hypothetical protein
MAAAVRELSLAVSGDPRAPWHRQSVYFISVLQIRALKISRPCSFVVPYARRLVSLRHRGPIFALLGTIRAPESTGLGSAAACIVGYAGDAFSLNSDRTVSRQNPSLYWTACNYFPIMTSLSSFFSLAFSFSWLSVTLGCVILVYINVGREWSATDHGTVNLWYAAPYTEALLRLNKLEESDSNWMCLFNPLFSKTKLTHLLVKRLGYKRPKLS